MKEPFPGLHPSECLQCGQQKNSSQVVRMPPQSAMGSKSVQLQVLMCSILSCVSAKERFDVIQNFYRLSKLSPRTTASTRRRKMTTSEFRVSKNTRICQLMLLDSPAHSTICQPDDSHTFGRTFGGRPAREATDRRTQREPPWRQKFKLPPRYVQNEGDISRWCGRITARDQPGAPDILVTFPLVSIHSSP